MILHYRLPKLKYPNSYRLRTSKNNDALYRTITSQSRTITHPGLIFDGIHLWKQYNIQYLKKTRLKKLNEETFTYTSFGEERITSFLNRYIELQITSREPRAVSGGKSHVDDSNSDRFIGKKKWRGSLRTANKTLHS